MFETELRGRPRIKYAMQKAAETGRAIHAPTNSYGWSVGAPSISRSLYSSPRGIREPHRETVEALPVRPVC